MESRAVCNILVAGFSVTGLVRNRLSGVCTLKGVDTLTPMHMFEVFQSVLICTCDNGCDERNISMYLIAKGPIVRSSCYLHVCNVSFVKVKTAV